MEDYHELLQSDKPFYDTVREELLSLEPDVFIGMTKFHLNNGNPDLAHDFIKRAVYGNSKPYDQKRSESFFTTILRLIVNPYIYMG